MTTPMLGFGANEVDFRGIRTPCSAAAITSERAGGCTAMTIPGCLAVLCKAWSRPWW